MRADGSDAPEVIKPVDPDAVVQAISVDEQDALERALFRSSAILCDLYVFFSFFSLVSQVYLLLTCFLKSRGTLLEYAAPVEDENRPFDVEMVRPMEDCRICVVRKRESLPGGKIHLTTAIYAFADDRKVRIQQRSKSD